MPTEVMSTLNLIELLTWEASHCSPFAGRGPPSTTAGNRCPPRGGKETGVISTPSQSTVLSLEGGRAAMEVAFCVLKEDGEEQGTGAKKGHIHTTMSRGV